MDSLYLNCDSTTIRVRHDDTTTHSTTTEVIEITIRLRYDYDKTMTRLRRKIDMLICCSRGIETGAWSYRRHFDTSSQPSCAFDEIGAIMFPHNCNYVGTLPAKQPQKNCRAPVTKNSTPNAVMISIQYRSMQATKVGSEVPDDVTHLLR